MDPQLVKYRRLPFGATLIAYFLPFVSMTCMGQKLSFTGMQVAFGTSIEGQRLNGEPIAILVLVLAIAALVSSWQTAKSALLKAEIACGAGGTLLLLALASKVRGSGTAKGVVVGMEFGYGLALVSLLAGGVIAALLLYGSGAPVTAPAADPPPTT